jgi:hypothetical protein
VKTWQAGVNKALRLWARLPDEQQQALLTKCSQAGVIEVDTSQSPHKWSIVSILFGMDVSINSPKLYLFPSDIPQKEK